MTHHDALTDAPTELLRINFVLPPVNKISGGPLAILEYANRLAERGHKVSVTTYPNNMWEGDSPFPWFDFKGEMRFLRCRPGEEAGPIALPPVDSRMAPVMHQFAAIVTEWPAWSGILEAMPDCDVNIATLWLTLFPIMFSGRGRPVIFMQHLEEIFYSEPHFQLERLMVRYALSLPSYKVANSSWLQKAFAERFGQVVPWSNNALDQKDFWPRPKRSREDGVLRVVTYSRPDAWKGFPDAVAAMAKVRDRFAGKLEWHVFGYQHNTLAADNRFAPYTYHPKLSFKELSALYATSDIALCPSWYESFPLPPLEAMASGTPPVTTAMGTEDYAFDGRNAIVVQSRDTEEMAGAVLRLLEDEALRGRLAAEGLLTAAEYTWDRAVRQREEILIDIHNDRTKYDREQALGSGLRDATGRRFEEAPDDALNGEGGLRWDLGGHLFLVHNRCKRHVQQADFIPLLIERGWRYAEIDEAAWSRIPLGRPLAVFDDLPRPLSRSASS